MRAQRSMLGNKLRDSVHADDITAKMVAYKDKEKEEIFKKELAKFDDQVKIIRLNIKGEREIDVRPS